MTAHDLPSTRSSSTNPVRGKAGNDGQAVPFASSVEGPTTTPSAPAGLTSVSRARRGLHDTEAEGRSIMHRLLITSPWQRYQMDRDAAAPAAPDDET